MKNKTNLVITGRHVVKALHYAVGIALICLMLMDVMKIQAVATENLLMLFISFIISTVDSVKESRK